MESTGGFGGGLISSPRDARATGERKQRLPEAANESWRNVEQFLALSDEELSRIDPVVMNLVVAKGIPALAGLDIGRYVRLADEWAADLRARMLAKRNSSIVPRSTGTTILTFFGSGWSPGTVT
jgi:hypothetical protein